jgi:hypothetical protein
MQIPVETYRGVAIFKSRLVLCLANYNPASTHEWHEAMVGGWLMVGTLEQLRREIDKRLDIQASP